MTNTRSGMTPCAIEVMIDIVSNAALEAHRVNQNLELGNGNDNGNGNENGNGNDNGNGVRLVVVNCTLSKDFMMCQPISFKGNRRSGWYDKVDSEKMGLCFYQQLSEKYQVKYATCTLLDSALTWWNSHKRTIGTDAAYALSWRELMKLMTEVYCPRNEIQKDGKNRVVESVV
ncbi:hypothetical protein Tco_0354982 [Tanacetum coccineum]